MCLRVTDVHTDKIYHCVIDVLGNILNIGLVNVSQILASWIAQEALANWERTWLLECFHSASGHHLILALQPLCDVSNISGEHE